MEALFVSTGLVALAARYRKPGPIILGILVATIANHAFAGLIGTWLTALMEPQALRWVLGVSFIAMAVWIMVPDKLDDADATRTRFGVFGTTLITFFLAEMGDKTQIATVALAAQYQSLIAVVVGTTLGMMIANVPAIYLGDRFAHRLPVKLIHLIAAAVFFALGVATLLGAGQGFGF